MDQIKANDSLPEGQSPGDTGDAPGGVRSVQRAFSLLQCLTPDRPAATLTDFAQRSGLAISTVQRLLNTLEASAVLRRRADGAYTFGNVMLQIGAIALNALDLHRLVEPHLERLSRDTGETANFGILDTAGNVIYLRQTQSERALRHAGWLGRSFPAKGTAIGNALQGQVDSEGLVISRDTLEPDVTAVAAPIYGPASTGETGIAGGISITGPSFRIDDTHLAVCRAHVAAEARALSASIAGHWPHAAPDSGEDEA